MKFKRPSTNVLMGACLVVLMLIAWLIWPDSAPAITQTSGQPEFYTTMRVGEKELNTQLSVATIPNGPPAIALARAARPERAIWGIVLIIFIFLCVVIFVVYFGYKHIVGRRTETLDHIGLQEIIAAAGQHLTEGWGEWRRDLRSSFKREPKPTPAPEPTPPRGRNHYVSPLKTESEVAPQSEPTLAPSLTELEQEQAKFDAANDWLRDIKWNNVRPGGEKSEIAEPVIVEEVEEIETDETAPSDVVDEPAIVEVTSATSSNAGIPIATAAQDDGIPVVAPTPAPAKARTYQDEDDDDNDSLLFPLGFETDAAAVGK